MKTFFFAAAMSFAGHTANAQLVGKAVCPPFTVDLLSGTVNELVPKSAIVEIQGKFPCSTDMVETDSPTKCSGVFYPDKGINFYTGRQYIEMNEKFRGKVSPALLGASKNNLFKTLGHVKLKGDGWDAYQMGYGTLILYYTPAGKINKIQMSSKGTDVIKLCD